jgi:putative endonuclease
METTKQKSYVYILTNDFGNVMYVGSTDDLKTRLYQHKTRLIPGFTEKYLVSKLVYFEEHLDEISALMREKQIKGKTRAKKDKIVESMNPEWNDLSSKVA